HGRKHKPSRKCPCSFSKLLSACPEPAVKECSPRLRIRTRRGPGGGLRGRGPGCTHMPAFLNWLLRLIVTNPICMRLVQGGSRRFRHLFIRTTYLGVMIAVVSVALLGTVARAPSVRDLARQGALTFTYVSYLQVGLICLLTPVFMAGAIAQEANPQTWDI